MTTRINKLNVVVAFAAAIIAGACSQNLYAAPVVLDADFGATIRDDSDNLVDGGANLFMNETTWNDGAGSVLYWDLSALSGTVAGDATLTARVTAIGATSSVFGVYEIYDDNADWATAGNRIDYWNRQQAVNLNPSNPANGLNWLKDDGTDGASYREAINTASALDTLDNNGVNVGDDVTWTIPAAVVQSWIDSPAQNAGVMLTKTVDAGNHFYLSGLTGSVSPNLSFELAAASTAIPEPSTLVLAGIGLLGLLACGRRRNRRRA